MRLDANLSWELWPEVTRAAVYLYNRTPNYSNNWKTPYEIFFTHTAFSNGRITSLRQPNLSHLKTYGCKAFAMSDDTHRGKSRLQRLDPKAWIGYLVGYRSSNIYRIWIPSLAKVISTRDVTFDEQTVFDGKTEDLHDNLMHTTLEEIATLVRTLELPGPTSYPEAESFYEDDRAADDMQPSDLSPDAEPPGYHQGRKIAEIYLSPPPTPPPAAFLAEGRPGKSIYPTHGGSRTIPWQAAFMAGTQAGNIGIYQNKIIDKAQLKRLMAKGTALHESQLPPPPSFHKEIESHPLSDWWKKAEQEHLQSHYKMNS
jgi:hypothetical protein